MPDNKITVDLELQDDLTPKLQQVKTALSTLGANVQQLGAPSALSAQTGKGSIGNFAKEAGEGVGFLERQMEELKSGIGYTIGAWNLGFMLADKAVGLVSDSFQGLLEYVQTYIHVTNQLGGANEFSARSFQDMEQAAMMSWTGIAETAKRTMALYSAGFTMSEATKATQTVQQVIKDTGVDLTDIIAKAKVLSVSPAEAMKAVQAGGPFMALREPALAAGQKEALRPLEEAEMAMRHHVEEDALSQVRFRIEDEAAMTDRMINREMEHRHRAINEEIEDRHRAAANAEADQSRIISLAERGISQRREARHLAQHEQDLLGHGWRQYEAMGGERAAQDLADDKELFALRNAQQNLDDQHYFTQRAREQESTRTGRALQSESTNVRERQEDQSHDRMLKFHDTEIEMTRRHQKEKTDFEIDHEDDRLALAKKVSDAVDAYERQQAIKEAALHGRVPAPGLERARLYDPRANLGPETIGRLPEPESANTIGKQTDTLVNSIKGMASEATLKSIEDKLSSLLGGG